MANFDQAAANYNRMLAGATSQIANAFTQARAQRLARDQFESQQRMMQADLQRAQEHARVQSDAASRARGFQSAMLSGNPIAAESGRKAYLEQDPIGLLKFEAMTQQPAEKGPQLDAIGKEVVFGYGLRPGTQPFMEKYQELAAQQQVAGTGEGGTDAVGKLRREFQSLAQTKGMADVDVAYRKIGNTPNTGAGDMSLIFNFMKMVDPGSVVRESEFKAAASAGAYGERVKAMVDRVIGGQMLSPLVRQQFRQAAGGLYDAQFENYNRVADQYRGLAGRSGFGVGDVVLDLGYKPTGGDRNLAQSVVGDLNIPPPEQIKAGIDAITSSARDLYNQKRAELEAAGESLTAEKAAALKTWALKQAGQGGG